MKKRSGVLLRIIKIYFGILCSMTGIGCVVGMFSEMKNKIFFFPLGLVFFYFAYLLFKKKPAKIESSAHSNPSQSSVPQFPKEVLKDMRKRYTAMQAQGDLRIMKDCFSILQTTSNFETFFMRYDLMCRKAYTLLEAEQAKCKGIKKLHAQEQCELFLSHTQHLKIVFLDNSYKHEYESAMTLKTAKGQYNRMNRYMDQLIEYEDDFIDVSDAYEQTKSKVQRLLNTLLHEQKQGQE